MASQTEIRVRFLHFAGTEEQWLLKLSTSEWDNCIVYGYIYDNGELVAKRIYAGKDSQGKVENGFIYDIGEGNSKALVVNTYAEAEALIEAGKIKEGNIVIVKTGDKAGDYIAISQEETIILIRLDNKWTYGDPAENWHTANDLTTATVGGIQAGTKLGDLIAATENGDFSRIIEKMLFAPAHATVSVDILDATVSYTSFNVKVIAKDYDTIRIELISGSTVVRTLDYAETIEVTGLNANTNYKVKAYVSNASYQEEITASDTAKTLSYVLPEATISFTASSTPDENNGYKITEVSATSGEQHDYTSTFKNIVLMNGNQVVATGEEAIKLASLDYNINYTLNAIYDIENIHTGETQQNVVLKSESVFKALPQTGSITIAKINGETTWGDPEEVSSADVELTFTANPRLTSGYAIVYIDGNETEYGELQVVKDQEYTLNINLGDARETAHAVAVKLFDRYDLNNPYATSNVANIKYSVALSYLIGTYCIADNGDFIFSDGEGGEVEVNINYNDNFTGNTPEDMVELSIDKDYDVLESGIDENKGVIYNYVIKCSEETLENIYDLPQKTKEGDANVYYQYSTPDTKDGTQGFCYVIVPLNYKVEFYAKDLAYNPGDKIADQKCSSITTTYNNSQYNVYYETAENWSVLQSADMVFITITKI